MGGQRRRRRDADPDAGTGPCSPGECHGGACVAARAPDDAEDARVCRCEGGWGGPRCAHYVGHDHACRELACRAPAICAWRPTLNPADAGTPYCACPVGERCPGPGAEPGRPPAPTPVRGSELGPWVGGMVGMVAGVGLLLFVLHRRRLGSYGHARLADNVEISNPMYLADDEGDAGAPLPTPPRALVLTNGNHFANPVYDTMYARAPPHAPEEQDNLLSAAGDGSPPPPERAALL